MVARTTCLPWALQAQESRSLVKADILPLGRVALPERHPRRARSSVRRRRDARRMSTSLWIQFASVIFAAVAAAGSAGAAAVMYRQMAASATPALSVDLAEVLPRGSLFLTVVNYGGPIKKVSFAAVEGTQACMSFLPPHGFLGPGERARIQLGMDSAGDRAQVAVVYGFDLASRYVYAWAANGQAGRWPARSSRWRRRPTDLSAVQILQRFYPGVADPTTLQQRAIVLMPPAAV